MCASVIDTITVNSVDSPQFTINMTQSQSTLAPSMSCTVVADIQTLLPFQTPPQILVAIRSSGVGRTYKLSLPLSLAAHSEPGMCIICNLLYHFH
jgi:hypothetical protein